LAISIAIVIGPTPPGTGVIRQASGATAAKSTSPHTPSRVRCMPTSMTTTIFGAALRGVDVVASNVPGAPIELFTAGARINSMFALGPMAGSAVNLTLLSYLDQVHIGVNVDPAAVTEPDRFLAAYRAGWDEVLAAAGA